MDVGTFFEESEEILREFCSDVRAVNAHSPVRDNWPDLYLTYQRAEALLKRLDKHRKQATRRQRNR